MYCLLFSEQNSLTIIHTEMLNYEPFNTMHLVILVIVVWREHDTFKLKRSLCECHFQGLNQWS